MRVFIPVVPEDVEYEWALPFDDTTGHDLLRIDTFASVAGGWSPVAMKLLREDEGRRFEPADLPWLGDHALVMRKRAAEVLGPLLAGQAELLPLSCPEADLWLLHAMECRNALVENQSDIVRFSSGRIMTIRSYAFDPEALEDARCFKIPQMPTGSIFLAGEVVDAIRAAGLTGFAAEKVWNS